ncbi:MAG: glycosyltransferase family 39 protein [Candidatus Eisenbacteria sp.]|nr:glycosyltransferase family 39 protein [Candidatus Eisenbacteria bacterium]
MPDTQKKSSSRPALLIVLLVWGILVLYLFAARHPVRSGLLWLSYLSAAGTSILLLVSAAVMGRRILGWLGGFPPGRGQHLLFSIGTGLFVLTYLTLGLGLAGALYRWLGWVLILAPPVILFRDTRKMLEDARGVFRDTANISLGSAGLLLALGPPIVGALWLALAPASAHDALVYHLSIPRHYVSNHRIIPLPLNVYSNMPHNLETLLTLAYLTGGEPAARVMDFAMRLLVCTGIFVLARRFIPPPGALLAVALFLVNPLTTSARTVGNIDLGMAFFFVLAVQAVLGLPGGKRNGSLWLAALFSGYLMGCKYTGAFYALSIGALAALTIRPLPPRRWGAAIAIAASPLVPWLIKDLAFTGNPVYPLLPSLFPSREWEPLLGQQLVAWQRSMGMGRGFADYLLLPWNIAVEGQMGRNYRFFDGMVSALPLAIVPFAMLMRDRSTWLKLLGLCVIPFIGWAATSQQLRFLIPLLPLTAVVTAAIIWQLDSEGFASRKRYFRTFGIGAVLGCLVVFQIPLIARNVARVLPVVSGEMPREDYLTKAVQSYGVIRKANETLPPDARVLMIWENSGYYMERPYLADSFFEASQIAHLAAGSGSPSAFVQSLRKQGIAHVIYNHGLGRFFERQYPPEYGAFLRELVSEHLEIVYSERDVVLYRIKD